MTPRFVAILILCAIGGAVFSLLFRPDPLPLLLGALACSLSAFVLVRRRA